jgi:serine/threonine protein kinase
MSGEPTDFDSGLLGWSPGFFGPNPGYVAAISEVFRMSDALSRLSQSLLGSHFSDTQKICAEFLAAWSSGAKPALEMSLAKASAAIRPGLLRELLRIEFSFRRLAGESPSLDEYVTRFPDLSQIIDAVFRENPTEIGTPPVSSTPTTPWTTQSHSASFLPEIPGYEILHQLAPGGMGVVFRARDLAADRTVALKMIRSGIHAEPHEKARFRLESEAIASLNHPNVVQIFGYGDWQGMPYLVMEFAEGGSLAQLVDSGPLAFDRAAEMVERLSGAVQFVHEKGILHRDLKPANILLSSAGVPKVADFGLAKRLDFDQGLTQTQAILGTASYMAPEQAAGTRQGLGPAVDIYALGAILYEALTGRPPFRAESRDLTIHQVLSQAAPRPSQFRADLPVELEAICLKCLEKDAGHRFASARALAEELRRFRTGMPLSIRSGSFERRRRLARQASYEILEALEPEGSCCRYRARHLTLNRVDVLEIFPGAPEESEQRNILREHTEAIAKLHHAHIVEIYTFGNLDDDWFIAREHIDGKALFEHWPDRLESPAQAAAVIESLARALQHASQLGIKHANLRPNKILVGQDGNCKLTGFTNPTSRASGGYGLAASTAAEIAFLGNLLSRLLHGQPHPSDRLSIGATLPGKGTAATLTDELDAICRKCLDTSSESAYPNVAALAEDLRRARAGEVLLIDDLDEWTQQQRWARRAGYRILEQQGQNQHGFTYKAQHLEQDRVVVLKRISARFRFVPGAKERFRLEAKLMESLRHPQIARIFDQGEQNDLVYYAREYVDGRSLGEIISIRAEQDVRDQAAGTGSEHEQRVDQAIALIQSLTNAILHAHSKGVVHGSLNPSCVHLTSAGILKITSFRRMSFFTQKEPDLAGELERKLIRAYIAPEMREVSRRRVERSADVFSLGAILFALLTGKSPAEDQASEWAVGDNEGASPRYRKLLAVCRKCIDPTPEQRYSSVEEFEHSLQAPPAP